MRICTRMSGIVKVWKGIENWKSNSVTRSLLLVERSMHIYPCERCLRSSRDRVTSAQVKMDSLYRPAATVGLNRSIEIMQVSRLSSCS